MNTGISHSKKDTSSARMYQHFEDLRDCLARYLSARADTACKDCPVKQRYNDGKRS
jgi:hypothetical protein